MHTWISPFDKQHNTFTYRHSFLYKTSSYEHHLSSELYCSSDHPFTSQNKDRGAICLPLLGRHFVFMFVFKIIEDHSQLANRHCVRGKTMALLKPLALHSSQTPQFPCRKSRKNSVRCKSRIELNFFASKQCNYIFFLQNGCNWAMLHIYLLFRMIFPWICRELAIPFETLTCSKDRRMPFILFRKMEMIFQQFSHNWRLWWSYLDLLNPE